MTGGPAAAKGIAIFSIAVQRSALKNRSWKRSLSSSTAYVFVLLHIRNYPVGSVCSPFAFNSLRKSSTVHEAPWALIRCTLFLLTHQILHVSTHTNKSKDVNHYEKRGQVCGSWWTIQSLPLKYSVTRRQKCDEELSCFRHVISNLRGTSILTWWQVLYEKQAVVWCSTSLTINIIIRWSQTNSH